MLQRGGGRGHETDPMYSSMQAPKVGTWLVGNTGGTVPVQCYTVPVQNTERPSSASNRRDSLSVASVVCRVRLAQASSATLETLGGSDGEVGGFQGSWTVQGVLNMFADYRYRVLKKPHGAEHTISLEPRAH